MQGGKAAAGKTTHYGADADKRPTRIFKVFYFSILLLVLLAALTAVINPQKELQLYPGPGSAVHLYADSIEPGGTSTVNWVDRDNTFYECTIAYGIQYPYCGVVIKYKRPDSKNYLALDYFEFSDATTLDLSEYDGVYLSLEYWGPSTTLYMFMRNAPKLPGNSRDYDLMPYLHADFAWTGKAVFVEFSRVQVARWWIDRYDPPQALRDPSFDNIFELGVELPALPPEGEHKLKLNSIIARKSYVSPRHLLLFSAVLIGLGCLVLMIQGLLKYFSNRRENETLRTRMMVDPLTQCLNRLGLETAIKGIFPLSNPASIFVMVLDLDHFKKINDTLGHAVGDEVLRKASQMIAQELRSDDVFGRWGGEEFVVISKISAGHLESLVARLMRSLELVKIEGAPDCRITMSVGIAEARVDEPFEEVFKRADAAMYQVKLAGRGDWKRV